MNMSKKKFDVSELKDYYDSFIEDLTKKRPKDRLEAYMYIKLLWYKLNLDLQTWKMIFDNTEIMSEIEPKQLEEMFEGFRQATLSITKMAKGSLDYEVIKEVFEKLKEGEREATNMGMFG